MKVVVVLGLVLAIGLGIPWVVSAAVAIQFWNGYSSAGPNEALYGATFFGLFSLLGLMLAGFAYIKIRLDRIEGNASAMTSEEKRNRQKVKAT